MRGPMSTVLSASVEMNDQENAKKILSDLIKGSKSVEIKIAARDLFKKLS